MKKIKNILKNFFLIITILILFILYKEHARTITNAINSFDFIVINLSIKTNDKATLKYKIKKNKLFNQNIDKLLFDYYDIKKDNIDNKFIQIKKELKKINIKNKINILKK